MKIKVLSIIGTRPETIKMAPVIKALQSKPEFDPIVCVTAQHRQILDQVLTVFNITPEFDLNLMLPNQSITEISSAIFTHVDPLIKRIQPDWILVQGDTTTVMVSGILAYYNRVLLGHVEAGLRTFNKYQPFPEEINRTITSTLADLHFAPTTTSRNNLLKQGIPDKNILITGNPVIDAIQSIAEQSPSEKVTKIERKLGIAFDERSSEKQPYLILVTAHRRENFGKPLKNICVALTQLSQQYGQDVRILFPVHPNPNVTETVYPMLNDLENVFLVPPLDYLTFVHILKRSYLVLTDSGGLQEEAPGFGIPVLVLRNLTERPEGVEAGTVKLVGTETEVILKHSYELLNNPRVYTAMASAVNPYGDGQAAGRIVQGIIEYESHN
jgi:UDP-N-acetylglucosamine 2-epimerase (non-hydrolysing)